MNSAKKQYKRYRLHQIIKHHFRYNPRKYTIYCPVGYESKKYPYKSVKAVKKLQALGYSLQTEIV